jgi:dihydroflavonol-4-reductase
MNHVFLTGATGFIGSSVARVLLDANCHVRALIRPDSSREAIAGLPIEAVPGDLRDPDSLRRGIAGCSQVYHVAALYTYWPSRRADLYDINVTGTRNVLAAALDAGVERVVYTSSVATLGIRSDGPADEETPATLTDMVGDYKRSKYLAEQVALEFAAAGLPVVIVNPSTPVGVRDVKPTPTGRIILDFLTGRMPAYVDTGLNLVDVEDVAVGHWLAAENGQPGRRYILGNRDMTMQEILQTLARITGRPAPHVQLPFWVAQVVAYGDVALARLIRGYTPRATPDTVRLARKHMYFDPSRAVRELGLPQTDPEEALRKAVEWFRLHHRLDS